MMGVALLRIDGRLLFDLLKLPPTYEFAGVIDQPSTTAPGKLLLKVTCPDFPETTPGDHYPIIEPVYTIVTTNDKTVVRDVVYEAFSGLDSETIGQVMLAIEKVTVLGKIYGLPINTQETHS